jgi:hypothetical protein
MKLGGLLSDIKGKQSRLSRLMDISKEIFYYEEGKSPKLDYKEISKEIDSLVDEIRHLKVMVQGINIANKLPNSKMILAEAIIKVADLRSLIAYKSGLIKYERNRSIWDEDRAKVNLIPQVEEKTLEKEIEELSDEKIALDNAIQVANWSIEI